MRQILRGFDRCLMAVPASAEVCDVSIMACEGDLQSWLFDVRPDKGSFVMGDTKRQRVLVLLCCAAVFLGFHVGCESESKRRRDLRFRGEGSQEVWLEATDGRYDGNLPPE